MNIFQEQRLVHNVECQGISQQLTPEWERKAHLRKRLIRLGKDRQNSSWLPEDCTRRRLNARFAYCFSKLDSNAYLQIFKRLFSGTIYRFSQMSLNEQFSNWV